jgi:hypothetical protein
MKNVGRLIGGPIGALAMVVATVIALRSAPALAQTGAPSGEEVTCVKATFVFPPAAGRYRVIPSWNLGDRPVSMATFGKIAGCTGSGWVGNNKLVYRIPFLPGFGPVQKVKVTFAGCSPSGYRIYTAILVEVTRSGNASVEIPESAIRSELCNS